jgi:hypothetical protein
MSKLITRFSRNDSDTNLMDQGAYFIVEKIDLNSSNLKRTFSNIKSTTKFTGEVSYFISSNRNALRSVSSTFTSDYKRSIFHYLTDNFVIEGSEIRAIIQQIFSKKVDIETLKEYTDTADLYFKVRTRLLEMIEVDQKEPELLISLIPEEYTIELSDAFDKFVDEYIFPRMDQKKGFDITIR